MSTNKPKAAELSPQWLQRYVAMRERLGEQTGAIECITSLLGHFDRIGDDRLAIDPAALGQVSQLLNDAVLNIQEILDDYLYIVDARLALDDLEGRESHERQESQR